MRIGFPKKIPSPIDQNCVGYWKFDESSGNIKDWSGNNNIGIAYNLTYSQAGKFGNACSFNGSTSYVDVGNTPSLNFTTDFSVEYWIKLQTGGSVVSSFGSSWKYINRLYIDGSGSFDIQSGGWQNLTLPVGTTPGSGVWFHFMYSRTGSTGKVYINGVSKVSATQTGNMPTDQPIRFMKRADGDYEPVNGTIDEIRIYNRALSAQEIKRHYMAGR